MVDQPLDHSYPEGATINRDIGLTQTWAPSPAVTANRSKNKAARKCTGDDDDKSEEEEEEEADSSSGGATEAIVRSEGTVDKYSARRYPYVHLFAWTFSAANVCERVWA